MPQIPVPLLRITTVLAFIFTTALSTCAEDMGRVLFEDGYEKALDVRIQIHDANQPYEQHELGLSTEMAHAGIHSAKIDLTYHHGVSVYLAPRSNETPVAEWGSLGGPGTFVLPGLGIPLKSDRTTVLTLSVCVVQASPQNPVGFQIETAVDSDYGTVRTQTALPQVFDGPTDGWVKIETELTGFLFGRMEASGARTDSLRLHSLSLTSFTSGRMRLTAFVDDVSLREVPAAVAGSYPVERAGPEAPSFRAYPEIEDLFVWGAYGDVHVPGPDWYQAYDRASDERLQQMERLRTSADWIMLDLRRHYCNVFVQGGGMLFPRAEQSSYEYTKAVLDKAAEYGIRLSPSTYLTQHYDNGATREQCAQAMRKAADMFRDHPGLLAYWLVDEPGASTAADFYWGKDTFEALDPHHPSLCTCNSIASIAVFAQTLPIVCVDYYPIGPVPAADKGAWAVGDAVHFAKSLGAHRVWVLPQVFGQSSWRSPSLEEFLIQIWSSLACGATGFAPYAYAEQPVWFRASNEWGRLVDPFGNANAQWDEMKRLGPLLRSAGLLLAGAHALDDGAAVVETAHVVVSNVGRARQAGMARVFADPRRDVRYIVVTNTTRFYRQTLTVRLREMAETEQILDLFALRPLPNVGTRFSLTLAPGDGRILALGSSAALSRVHAEVAAERFTIERDLLGLEVTVAERMGIDVQLVQAALAPADAAAATGNWTQAHRELGSARQTLERQTRACQPFRAVNDPMEACRQMLGTINRVMNRHIGDEHSAFPRTAPDVRRVADRMIELSGKFYHLASALLRDGPAGMAEDAEGLHNEVGAFVQETRLFFGE